MLGAVSKPAVKPKLGGGERIPDACAIAGVASLRGRPLRGAVISEMLKAMKPRYNGLGAGFAGYGIYPDFPDNFVFHLMFDDEDARKLFERELHKRFQVAYYEEIPTRSGVFDDPPILWRYFLADPGSAVEEKVFKFIMTINGELDGAYIVSSGRNMGIFKGIGSPEKIADFYKLEIYRGCLWLGHGRYPTNSPGWWGGAHPFNVLDFSVIHNGEISSYGISKRYLESKGYRLIFLTDSEMLSYALDYLLRVEGLSIEDACKVLSPPYWFELNSHQTQKWKILRIRYQELHVNGPFSIAAALRMGKDLYLLGLADRLKLRPLVAALSGDFFMVASEECSLRAAFPNLDKVWRPKAGQPVFMKVGSDEA